ncbi:hypothetical protein HDV02_003588 [Globomyces sp. JEL0801]|nr:hypothetical protein HDV02_003588 [Globomyces sp. JEL0801]
MNIPSKKGRYSPEATATLLKLYLQGVDRPNRAQREQLGLELNKTPRNSSSIPHIITNIHSTDSNHSPSVSPSDNLSSLDVSNVNSPVTNTPLMDSALLPSNSTISPVKSEFNYPIILDTNLKSPAESNIPINHSLSHMSPSSTVSVLNSPKLNSNLSSPKVKSNLSSPSKLSQNTLNSPSMSQEIQSQTTLNNSQPNLSTHYISNSQQPQVASLSIPLRPNTASHFPVSLSPVENIPSPLSMLLYPLIFLLDTTRPQNFQFVPSSIQVHTLPPNTQLFHGHSHTQQNPNIVQQSITLNQNTTFNNITQSFNMNLNQNTNNFRNPMTPPLNYNVTPIQSFFVPSVNNSFNFGAPSPEPSPDITRIFNSTSQTQSNSRYSIPNRPDLQPQKYLYRPTHNLQLSNIQGSSKTTPFPSPMSNTISPNNSANNSPSLPTQQTNPLLNQWDMNWGHSQ